MRRFAALVCFSAVALSACGGGAASSPALPGGPAGSTAADFVIRIPSATAAAASAMRPQYVSPSTQSVKIAVSGEASPVVANLTPSSPNCKAASGATPVTCTVSVTAPVGTDTFAVTMYDRQNAAGAVLSAGQVTATIVAGQTTPVNVVTNGTVCAIQLTLANAAPAQGKAVKIPLTVNVKDAAGNVIIGPGTYSTPISLHDSDAKYTALSTNTVTAPGMTVTLNYDGGPLTSAVISASAPGIAPTAITNATLAPTGAPAIAAIKLALSTTSVTPRQTSTSILTVTALDASGAVITGTYPSPIALTTSDTTGAVTITPATVTASGQPVTVKYSGSTLVFSGASINASSPGVKPANVTAAALTATAPCAPKFTPTNLYIEWDVGAQTNVFQFAPPYGSNVSQLNSVQYPVFMTIDPSGRIFTAQANTPAYPGPSADVVYMTAPFTAPPVAVTPSTLEIYGTALDDKDDLFVAQINGSILTAPGPLPAPGSFYATPTAIPNSPPSVYSLAFDRYCNLFAGGANGTIYVIGTTGQPGGAYGQLKQIVNAKLATTTGVGGLAVDAKGNVFFAVGPQFYELPPPYTQTPTALVNVAGAGITSMAVDAAGNVLAADYNQDEVYEIPPPYTTYTAISGDTLSDSVGVVVGP